jgi:hypothetical protein
MSRSVQTVGTFMGPIIAGIFYDHQSYMIAFAHSPPLVWWQSEHVSGEAAGPECGGRRSGPSSVIVAPVRQPAMGN